MSTQPSTHHLLRPAFAALMAGLLASLIPMRGAFADAGIVVSKELRLAPSPTAAVVDRLPAGTRVSFLLRRGQWLAIRNGNGLAWVLAVQGLDPDVEQPPDNRCPAPRGDIAEPRLHERARLAGAARLRGRLGREDSRDLKLAPGTHLYVHASALDGAWILVEAKPGQLGWVRHCEIEVAARQGTAGDDVVVARADSLRSDSGRAGRRIASLSPGLRLAVEDRENDWVRVTTDDGTIGWLPVGSVRWRPAEARDPSSLWQTGVEVDWPCDGRDRAAGTRKISASSVRCGDRLRIVRGSGTEKQPLLLVVADDGRWGWVHDPVVPLAIGDAVVRDNNEPKLVAAAGHDTAREPARSMRKGSGMADDVAPTLVGDLAPSTGKTPRVTDKLTPAAVVAPSMNDMPGMADEQPTAAKQMSHDMGHEAMMGMGQGDMSAPSEGAAMSLSLQTAVPVGHDMASADDTMMRTPRYEVSATASGSGRITGDYSYGLAATFSAARSLSADGQARQEEYQGGQLALSLSRPLGDSARLSLAGGYSFAFRSPGSMANSEWDFIAIHPGPFGRLSLSGDLTERLSFTLRGTAQLTQDADGMASSILMADAMTMLAINAWLTAGLNGMAMRMAMGDTMISAGPSLSVGLLKHFSVTAAATAMRSGGMTMWTATSGLGAHF